jgi:hypothetical protein
MRVSNQMNVQILMRPVCDDRVETNAIAAPSGEKAGCNIIRGIVGEVDDVLTAFGSYHALTTIQNADELGELTFQMAASWLALGLDPNRAVFYKQSEVPELLELSWILSCFIPKGLLNRAHAYKSAVDRNVAEGKPPDEGINAGLGRQGRVTRSSSK